MVTTQMSISRCVDNSNGIWRSYYSALRRNDPPSCTCYHMDENFENMVLYEISQTQRNKYCTIPFIWGTQNRQIYEPESQIVVPSSLERMSRSLMSTKFLFGMMKRFQKCILVMDAYHCYWFVHLKVVQSMNFVMYIFHNLKKWFYLHIKRKMIIMVIFLKSGE